ncbi:MAG TPA: hypothetical protein VFI25_14775 [Planctomycetota bacterium]|jgi:hypothetical protein|nr:hypothetical protein [Planctomycetota bacterium]
MRIGRPGLLGGALLLVGAAAGASPEPRASQGSATKPAPTGAELSALKSEFQRRREALAKGDASSHLDLARWCAEVGLKVEEKTVLKQVLVLDPDHEEARRRLGYVRNEAGKWVLEEELRKQREKDEEQENLRNGLVRYKGGWVAKEDVPFLEKGMVRRDGAWMTKEEIERLEKGWKRVDGEWISPEEAPQLEKGLFKVDGKWVSKQEANRIRSDWEKAWRMRGEHVLVRTNVDRDAAEGLVKWAEAAYGRVKGVLGKDANRLPLLLFGLKTLDEYNRFAGQVGDHHSSVYGAYFAAADEERPGVFVAGDKNWSPFNITHAVGHAYLDRLVRTGKEKEEEEAIPAWLEEGLAAYVEWFHKDVPKDSRSWVIEQRINKVGGLDSLKQLSKSFEISRDDPGGSVKRIVEAGLVVGYYVETHDDRDRKLFADVVKAIGAGNPKEIGKAAGALVQDGAGLERKVRAFAGLK